MARRSIEQYVKGLKESIVNEKNHLENLISERDQIVSKLDLAIAQQRTKSETLQQTHDELAGRAKKP